MNTQDADCLVTVIVPTYREAENLPILVPQIAAALERGQLRGEILIVDDNSQDGTDQVCRELAAQYPVRLEVRTQERGLAGAVVHGMRQARGTYLVVMDADLSHPAERIPDLISALQADSTDFVIGSRYVAGGAIEERWTWFRRLNSKVATLLAWPLTSIHDPMAGFFALRRTTFESAATLDPIGYKIGLELIVKCDCRSIKEVPIHFRDRVHGQSKLSLKEQIDYLRHLVKLYAFKHPGWTQFIQFALVGSTGMAIDLASFSLLLLALRAPAARALAIWIAMTWNYALNRSVTFSGFRSRPLLLQYLYFCLSCLLGAVVNWSISIWLLDNVPYFAEWPLLAAFLGVLGGTTFNFLCSKHLVFR